MSGLASRADVRINFAGASDAAAWRKARVNVGGGVQAGGAGAGSEEEEEDDSPDALLLSYLRNRADVEALIWHLRTAWRHATRSNAHYAIKPHVALVAFTLFGSAALGARALDADHRSFSRALGKVDPEEMRAGMRGGGVGGGASGEQLRGGASGGVGGGAVQPSMELDEGADNGERGAVSAGDGGAGGAVAPECRSSH